MASAFNSLARYGLSSIELRRASTRGGANAPAWENKSMYIFYIELVTGQLKDNGLLRLADPIPAAQIL